MGPMRRGPTVFQQSCYFFLILSLSPSPLLLLSPHSNLIFINRDDPTCATERVLTDAYVKVLLLDGERDKLIVCTSLYQGTCNRKQRGDISRKEELVSAEHVVANDAASSTVAFIAPGL